MKAEEALKPGRKLEIERVVDDSLLTRHVGGRGVFATPAMIGLMEMASHRLVEPHLPEGMTTVGYEVHVRHLASSPPGARLRVTSELKEVVDGRKLTFEVQCHEGEKLVGTGTHKRAIVPASF
ncbi:MAG TPA: thioesterase family protein [Candidatus Acidoferrales bacterium]|nr:thioesterase family protein [Candidatus Acidoferrales bacterium]